MSHFNSSDPHYDSYAASQFQHETNSLMIIIKTYLKLYMILSKVNL